MKQKRKARGGVKGCRMTHVNGPEEMFDNALQMLVCPRTRSRFVETQIVAKTVWADIKEIRVWSMGKSFRENGKMRAHLSTEPPMFAWSCRP